MDILYATLRRVEAVAEVWFFLRSIFLRCGSDRAIGVVRRRGMADSFILHSHFIRQGQMHIFVYMLGRYLEP